MPVAVELVFDIKDEANNPSTTSLKIPTGFTISQYTEFSRGMADAIDDFIDGKIEGASICFVADLSALSANATSGVDDVQELASFDYETIFGRAVSINIPAVPQTKVLVGSNDLDQADVDIAAFNTAILSGIAVTGGTITPCDIAEDDITTLKSARERFRSRGKRRKS